VNRQDLCGWANRLSTESRKGPAPSELAPTSSVVEVAEWLQWCDPNGSHLEHEHDEENRECDAHDEESAWETLADFASEEWAE